MRVLVTGASGLLGSAMVKIFKTSLTFMLQASQIALGISQKLYEI